MSAVSQTQNCGHPQGISLTSLGASWCCDPSPVPGHAAVGSLRLQAPGAQGLAVHPCLSASLVRGPEGPAARYRKCSPSYPWDVAYGSSPANPARRASRLSAHISRRGSHTCCVTFFFFPSNAWLVLQCIQKDCHSKTQ
jgi:hypothetical protein